MTVAEVAAPRPISRLELRAFAGLSMASAAISIDLILPAFAKIRERSRLAPGRPRRPVWSRPSSSGWPSGRSRSGLLADRFGRRLDHAGQLRDVRRRRPGRRCRADVALDAVGAFRVGAGAAGMRVIVDRHDPRPVPGADMAREMAFAMTIFILVPVVAPAARRGDDQGDAVAWHVRRVRGVRCGDRSVVAAPAGDACGRSSPTVAGSAARGSPRRRSARSRAVAAVHAGERGDLRCVLVVPGVVGASGRRGLPPAFLVPLHLRWHGHPDGRSGRWRSGATWSGSGSTG